MRKQERMTASGDAAGPRGSHRPDGEFVERLLARLGRQPTPPLRAAASLWLQRPGWTSAQLARALQHGGMPRRTAYWALAALHTPLALRTRQELVGIPWLCWACGESCGAVSPETVAGWVEPGAVLLDVGGYCSACLARLARGEPVRPPLPSQQGRAVAWLDPRAAYLGPLRPVLGWKYRTLARLYGVQMLHGDPRASTAELVCPPLAGKSTRVMSPSTAWRVLRRLADPRVQLEFVAWTQRLPWACQACRASGSITAVQEVLAACPTRLAPTDARACCPACAAVLQTP